MVVAPGAVLDEIRLLVGEVNAPLRVGVDDKVHANVGFGLRVDERDSLLLSSGGWFGLGVVVLSAVAGVGLHALEVFLLA